MERWLPILKKHYHLTLTQTWKYLEMGNSVIRCNFSFCIKSNNSTAEKLAGHADFLIGAGAKTTATAMTREIWFLGKNPACLSLLEVELWILFGRLQDITGDATAQLPYMNTVAEGSLRFIPSVRFGLQ